MELDQASGGSPGAPNLRKERGTYTFVPGIACASISREPSDVQAKPGTQDDEIYCQLWRISYVDGITMLTSASQEQSLHR
jgi:hypothetical protein